MTIDWKHFKQTIDKYQSFVLTSHIRPDCDALGSELGMAEVLRSVGKDVRIINAHDTPPRLQFLDPAEDIEVLGRHVNEDEIETDCIMVLDTSAWVQLGSMAAVIEESRAAKIIVDHHLGEDDMGASLFKDTSAEATGHLVVLAADALGVSLNETMAVPLFTAIATDTGWYRFSSTTADTYRCAGRLIDAGASPTEIYGDLYERDSLARVQLRGRILARTTPELGGRFVYTYVLAEDFEQTGALPSDTEDVINQTLAIAGTEAAVIMIEQLRGGFKVSFRSRCALNCSDLANTFGGGGHRAAAGAFVEGNIETVKEKVLPVALKMMPSESS